MLRLSERARPIKFARFEAVAGETMEIVVGDVAVRIGSDVEPERLAAVIRAVRQA
ncbi:IS66 family insertion sequence element accessory protein TnpB [Bradyrhizobium australiense]|uniref:IS66 family insertion sequence element accessory protein TnpB n=1 Tax=Bradyrhizobium australiense TaxID=2721161 RepID=UPI001F43D793|nr:IS66 family insertion sequence element accessory protein TnpB [Bradyrhizobium australiense]